MKGDFRVAIERLITKLGWSQYDVDHGEFAKHLLDEWDRNRGDDWVHTTLNEFKEKVNE